MAQNVLIADDSLTIQKVINITLSSLNYNLLQAQNYQELITHLQESDINLVLLDFNLSETSNGYDLASKIKEISPQCRILMMYGTFDTIEEDKLRECGVDNKVVKPFDSGQFINLCEDLLSGNATNNTKSTSESEIEEPTLQSEGWEMNTPDLQEDIIETENIELKAEETDDSLSLEVESWGMSVPSPIDQIDADENLGLPPQLEEGASLIDNSVNIAAEEVTIPSDTDLEYPSIDSEDTAPAPTSSFQSLDELSLEEDGEEEDTFSLDAGNEESLENEISVDSDTNSFWAADDGDDFEFKVDTDLDEPTGESEELEESHHIDNVVKTFQNLEEKRRESDLFNDDKIVEKLYEKIKPEIEQMVEKHIAKYLDQVAWDIIPDLAENIVKDEVKRISDSVMSSDATVD